MFLADEDAKYVSHKGYQETDPEVCYKYIFYTQHYYKIVEAKTTFCIIPGFAS